MSTGNPDLFVICKSCGAEVSPYITECPYCGNRLRKRAPKIDREGRVTDRRPRRRRPLSSRGFAAVRSRESGPILAPTPRRARDPGPGGLPGLADRADQPDTTIGIYGKPGSHWWRLLTSPFVYRNTGYAFVALGTIAVFGWLLERRHGPIPVLALFAVGGIGGTAVTVALLNHPVVLGANGAALALLLAWAIPDLIRPAPP